MRVRLSITCCALALVFTIAAPVAAKKPHVATRKRPARSTPSSVIAHDPYIGAIVVDASTGNVLIEDNADARGYPASVVKLMDLLIILEKVRSGSVKLSDMVTVTSAAANVGGSQAYLKKNETFSVNDLLYALMVKSANDAAVALAIHIAGSQEAFIALMNRKAQELGMNSTSFHSVNGLPHRGQPNDESTSRDLTRLARAVLNYPEALRYTSTKHCTFRKGTFSMSNHNHLLGVVQGCDGLKTGYFYNAGFSIVATAKRQNTRIIAIVLGSRYRQTRDLKARELLSKGFQELLTAAAHQPDGHVTPRHAAMDQPSPAAIENK